MKTPYGELSVGDVYFPAQGRGTPVKVVDVHTYAEQQDAVIRYHDGSERRMDWFKLMMVRYSKEEFDPGT